MASITITGNQFADALLSREPLALLIGMALDQQIPMEKAFAGPAVLRARLGYLDAARIAAADDDVFAAAMAGPPAVHRFPGSMGKRVKELCAVIAEDYDNRAESLWEDASTGAELLARVEALPGFANQKARIFVALLGKQLGVQPRGWKAAAGDYALAGFRSVADVVDEASLQKVRATKKEAKKAAKPAVKKADKPAAKKAAG